MIACLKFDACNLILWKTDGEKPAFLSAKRRNRPQRHLVCRNESYAGSAAFKLQWWWRLLSRPTRTMLAVKWLERFWNSVGIPGNSSTDVLVGRGNPEVVVKTAANSGAKIGPATAISSSRASMREVFRGAFEHRAPRGLSAM
jgi:hypothetical protein